MQYSNNSTRTQREKIPQALRKKPRFTLQLRHECDCLRVAPRIGELQHEEGYNIEAHWVYGENPRGGKHRIALYALFPGKYKGGN